MRVVFRSSSLIFTLLGIVFNAPVSRVREVLRRGQAGRVRIGMPVADVLALFGKRGRPAADGESIDVFLLSSLQGRPDLSIATQNGLVSVIRVYSRRYRTEDGIGVADPVAELAKAYPIRWLAESVAEVESLHMRFHIGNKRIASIELS